MPFPLLLVPLCCAIAAVSGSPTSLTASDSITTPNYAGYESDAESSTGSSPVYLKPNAAEVVPGGRYCSEFYEYKFQVDQDSRAAVFHDRALTNFLEELFHEGETVQSVVSWEYDRLLGGLRRLWACVNELAKQGYTVTGFGEEDITSFHRLGNAIVKENVQFKPLDLLAGLVIQERNLVDITLALNLVKYGVSNNYFTNSALVLKNLLQRMIPTQQIHVAPMENELLMSMNPYYFVNSEDQMRRKSAAVLESLPKSVKEAQDSIKKAIVQLIILSFQADNELILGKILMALPASEKTCDRIQNIRRTSFGSQPLNRFPRIQAWNDRVKMCPPLK